MQLLDARVLHRRNSNSWEVKQTDQLLKREQQRGKKGMGKLKPGSARLFVYGAWTRSQTLDIENPVIRPDLISTTCTKRCPSDETW